MNRITLPLLLVACSALAWAVWEHIQRTHLEDRLTKVESEASSRAERGPEQSKLGESRVVLKKSVGAQEVTGTNGETESGKTSGPPSTQAAVGELAEGFAKMMSNPKMRDMMKSQFRMGIDLVYRDLYDLLDLKEPQRSKFEKLINERASIGLEAGLDLMDGNNTAEERNAAAAEVK